MAKNIDSMTKAGKSGGKIDSMTGTSAAIKKTINVASSVELMPKRKSTSVKSSKSTVSGGDMILSGDDSIGSVKRKPPALPKRNIDGYVKMIPKDTKKTAGGLHIGNKPIAFTFDLPEKKQKTCFANNQRTIIMTTVALTAFLFFVIIFIIPSDKAPENKSADKHVGALPDLNKLCQRYQYVPSKDLRQCYFHPTKYPNSCTLAKCGTVLIVGKENMERIVTFAVKNGDEINHLDEIPDFTPCAEDRWCIKGVCTPTDDKRVADYSKHFDESIPTKIETWVGCKMKCLDLSNLRGSRPRFTENCTRCYGTKETNNHGQVSFRPYYVNYLPTFRSPNDMSTSKCSNTNLVVFIGDVCANCKDIDDPKRFISSEIPAKCEPDTGGLQCRLKCEATNQYVSAPEGYRCKTVKGESGFCFLNTCTPKIEDAEFDVHINSDEC